MINGPAEYYWHEMTFFIHQLDAPGSHITVLCFEVPDDPVNNDPTKPGEPEPEVTPHNFLHELKLELGCLPAGHNLDWRNMQSLLLRQAIIVVDRGVWACSNAVRKLEKVRPIMAAILAMGKVRSNLPYSPDRKQRLAYTPHSTSLAPTTFFGMLFIAQRSFKWLHRHLLHGLSSTA